MKLSVASLSDLDRAISEQRRSDYIYMYPPRQAYRPIARDSEALREEVRAALASQQKLNIYVHVPFCHQICGFCNLYATNLRSPETHRAYVDCVLAQISAYLPLIPDVEVSTIYFGGGTPTALAPDTLDRLVTGVLCSFPRRTEKCEIAIEVDPQTIDAAGLKRLNRAGINRINLGLQTRNDSELKTIGRRYRHAEQWALTREALAVGFDNVCLDLIYGLPGQTHESWATSILDCLELNPHTICCYPLTERPFTGFDKSARSRATDCDYAMWDHADQTLRAAGFKRQSHVRWARDGGGYLQKELHWACDNVLGFGAGARSYLWTLDLRNHYSILDRSKALHDFMDRIDRGEVLPAEGLAMNADERLRKATILGLHDLDREKTRARFGVDPVEAFGQDIAGLQDRGLLEAEGMRLRLTESGMKYRDLIVQMFVSEDIRRLTNEFDYRE